VKRLGNGHEINGLVGQSARVGLRYPVFNSLPRLSACNLLGARVGRDDTVEIR
jgi:hypothetical protein